VCDFRGFVSMLRGKKREKRGWGSFLGRTLSVIFTGHWMTREMLLFNFNFNFVSVCCLFVFVCVMRQSLSICELTFLVFFFVGGGGTDSVDPTIPCPLFFRAEKNHHLKALFAHSSPILAPHPCHPFVQREGWRP